MGADAILLVRNTGVNIKVRFIDEDGNFFYSFYNKFIPVNNFLVQYPGHFYHSKWINDPHLFSNKEQYE